MISRTVQSNYAVSIPNKEDEIRQIECPSAAVRQLSRPERDLNQIQLASPIEVENSKPSSMKKVFRTIFRPVIAITNWRSSNPVEQTEARNGVHDLAQMVASWSKNTLGATSASLQLISKVVYAALSWTAVGFTGLYGILTCADAVKAIRKRKKLEACQITSNKMQLTRTMASHQASARAKLKGLATSAATLQLIGGSICLGTANAFNPIGWVFLGLGLTITAGWFSYRLIQWSQNKCNPITEVPLSAPQAIAIDLYNGVVSENDLILRDTATLLRALDILKPNVTLAEFQQSPDQSIELFAQNLKGAEDYLL